MKVLLVNVACGTTSTGKICACIAEKYEAEGHEVSVTYSRSEFGGHTTTVNGNADEPTDEDILKVGRDAGLTLETCEEIMEEVKSCVTRMLGKFLTEAEV